MHVRHGRLVVVRALVPTAYVLPCTHTRGVVHVGALSFVIIIIIIIYHLFDYTSATHGRVSAVDDETFLRDGAPMISGTPLCARRTKAL